MRLLEGQNEAKQHCNRLKGSLECYQSQAVGKTSMNLLYNYCECTRSNIQQVYWVHSLSCCSERETLASFSWCKSIQIGCPVGAVVKITWRGSRSIGTAGATGKHRNAGTETGTEMGTETETETEMETEMLLNIELYHKWDRLYWLPEAACSASIQVHCT